jgi:hypothetical protein
MLTLWWVVGGLPAAAERQHNKHKHPTNSPIFLQARSSEAGMDLLSR